MRRDVVNSQTWVYVLALFHCIRRGLHAFEGVDCWLDFDPLQSKKFACSEPCLYAVQSGYQYCQLEHFPVDTRIFEPSATCEYWCYFQFYLFLNKIPFPPYLPHKETNYSRTCRFLRDIADCQPRQYNLWFRDRDKRHFHSWGLGSILWRCYQSRKDTRYRCYRSMNGLVSVAWLVQMISQQLRCSEPLMYDDHVGFISVLIAPSRTHVARVS